MPSVDHPTLHSLLQIGIRKTKRLIEFAIYGLFDTLVLLTCRQQNNTRAIAIVHLELLGDYVLWLPYARALVRHFQQRHPVVLVLNQAVLPLASRHFAGCTLFGIERRAFVRNPYLRAKCLRQLRRLGVRASYHDTYPRDAIIEDAAVRALGAPAWGFDATFADRPWLDCWVSRQLYTRLLPPMPGVHQGRRHHALLKAIGTDESALQMTTDFAAGMAPPTTFPYFVVAPGSSRSERSWPIENFIALARQVLAQQPDWRCILVGAPSERALATAIAQALAGQAANLAGLTDIVELTAWIAHSRLVIGNDSAACHIAAACGIPSLVVLGGGDYGRCFPYDIKEAYVGKLPVTVSEPMDCFGCEWLCRYRVRKGQPYLCIAAIPAERACAAVTKLLCAEASPADSPKPTP